MSDERCPMTAGPEGPAVPESYWYDGPEDEPEPERSCRAASQDKDAGRQLGGAVASSEESVTANVPITLNIDLDDLLQATVGHLPVYTGDPDDEDYEANPLYGVLVNAAASELARKIMSDAKGYQAMVTKVKAAIDVKLGELVTQELGKPFLPVDTYGEPKRGTDPTTLRELIGKQAADALARGMAVGDRYNNHSTGALKKYIDTEIDRQIKVELADAVREAKAAVVDKVKANVSQVITDTITRTAVR